MHSLFNEESLTGFGTMNFNRHAKTGKPLRVAIAKSCSKFDDCIIDSHSILFGGSSSMKHIVFYGLVVSISSQVNVYQHLIAIGCDSKFQLKLLISFMLTLITAAILQ